MVVSQLALPWSVIALRTRKRMRSNPLEGIAAGVEGAEERGLEGECECIGKSGFSQLIQPIVKSMRTGLQVLLKCIQVYNVC